MPFIDTQSVLDVTDWNEEYNEFVLQNHLTPSSKLLWQWLVHKTANKELEPNLQKKFNSRVEKYCGKLFNPKTIKAVIKQLNGCCNF